MNWASTVSRVMVGLVLVCSSLSAEGPERVVGRRPPDLNTRFERATAVRVFEGLPSDFQRLIPAQGTTGPTFDVSGYPFYEGALTVIPADQEALIRTARNGDTWREYGGAKACGGFHPDYLVEWTEGENVLGRALICFGCHEALWLIGDQKQVVDITEGGVAELRGQLVKYRRHRVLPFGRTGETCHVQLLKAARVRAGTAAGEAPDGMEFHVLVEPKKGQSGRFAIRETRDMTVAGQSYNERTLAAHKAPWEPHTEVHSATAYFAAAPSDKASRRKISQSSRVVTVTLSGAQLSATEKVDLTLHVGFGDTVDSLTVTTTVPER